MRHLLVEADRRGGEVAGDDRAGVDEVGDQEEQVVEGIVLARQCVRGAGNGLDPAGADQRSAVDGVGVAPAQDPVGHLQVAGQVDVVIVEEGDVLPEAAARPTLRAWETPWRGSTSRSVSRSSNLQLSTTGRDDRPPSRTTMTSKSRNLWRDRLRSARCSGPGRSAVGMITLITERS